MPPLGRLRIGALEELARQLRFEPPEAARRQLLNAEALARQVADADPDQAFPEDWIVHRITGFRPRMDQPALIIGGALVGDLARLIERLCVAANVTAEELTSDGPHAWLTADELCARWSVSRKTLNRYRTAGLLARRVADPDGRPRLVFSSIDVEAYESRHAARLARAGAFTRIDGALEARIIRRARRYRRDLGCSLNQAAARLAERFGRSHEAVRRILQRHDERSREPIFGQSGPLTDRRGRVIERAYRRGVSAATLARRFRRTPATIHRVVSLRRGERLRGLSLAGPAWRELAEPAARRRVLAPSSVQTGLGAPAPSTLADVLGLAASRAEPRTRERERAEAMRYLRSDAARRILDLSEVHPAATKLDRIETDLLWASRLKAELIRAQLPLAIKTIEGRLPRAVTSLPGAAAADLVGVCIGALRIAAERYDVFKGGRLAAPAGLELNRAITRWLKGPGSRWASPPDASLAAARVQPEGVALPDWTRALDPWQAWLEPDPRIRAWLGMLGERDRRIVELRFGLGGAPHTAEQIAASLDLPRAHATRLVRSALRAALEECRRQSVGGE